MFKKEKKMVRARRVTGGVTAGERKKGEKKERGERKEKEKERRDESRSSCHVNVTLIFNNYFNII